MGAGYHQFCPVAKAMELLDERWTMLLVRELILGSERFNDLRRGLPRMSPSLLSKRLHQLVAAGVVERRTEDGDVRYALTDAGRELAPVVEALGVWGTRWIGELGDMDYDPKLLLWDMHRNVDAEALPRGRTVARFRFRDVPRSVRDWWLVLVPGEEAEVCDEDPGFDVSVTVDADLRSLVQVWRGDVPWERELRAGRIRVEGPTELRRALPGWFTLSPFAVVQRVTPTPA
jgi:DNA-binding HxlR family transcriptional regulator